MSDYSNHSVVPTVLFCTSVAPPYIAYSSGVSSSRRSDTQWRLSSHIYCTLLENVNGVPGENQMKGRKIATLEDTRVGSSLVPWDVRSAHGLMAVGRA